MSTLLIEVNGTQYSNFKSASVRLQLDAIAGNFDFVAVSKKTEPLPIKLNDECSIIVDDEKVLTGFVESVDVDYDATSHSINITGRSKTADIIDSMINSLEIKPPITLKAVIEKVIVHIGAEIKIIENTTVEKFNSAEDLLSPEIGQNAFEFIEKLARKRQVLLTCNGEGNIVITQSSSDSAPIGLQNIIDGNENNIESASVSYDSTERFGKYVSKSQLNLTALNVSGKASSKDIVNQKSSDVIDEQVRQSRQFVIQAESASSDQQNQKRAQWEANIRKTRSIVYSTVFNGFGVNGKIWMPNQLTSIKDEFAGINAEMLLNSVIFSQDGYSANTSLAFVEKDAYTLKLNEPIKGNVLGEGLV